MHLSTEAARSDFILAAAFVLVGPWALALASLPIEVVTGSAFLVHPWSLLVLMAFITVWFPRWLATQRGDGLDAFALDGPPSRMAPGVVLALPVIVAYVATQWGTRGFVEILTGRLADLGPNPTVGEASGHGVGDLLLSGAIVGLLFVGAATFWSFMAIRAHEAFRSPDRSVAQALRTYGMVAAGATLVIGGLWSLVNELGRPLVVLANVAALVVVILLADRMIGLAPTTTRATFVGPMILLAWYQIQPSVLNASSIDPFDVYAAALSMGYLVVFIALIEARKSTWAALPMLLAGAWIPGCADPLRWALRLIDFPAAYFGLPGC